MKINYKGVMKDDKSSKRYQVFKVINEEYGCLSNFLKDISLEIEGSWNIVVIVKNIQEVSLFVKYV